MPAGLDGDCDWAARQVQLQPTAFIDYRPSSWAVTADGVLSAAAVAKSYSARTRSWNWRYMSTMPVCG